MKQTETNPPLDTETTRATPVKTTADFLLPECDNGRELALFVTELENCLGQKPKQLTLKFFGMQCLGADSALAIFDCLQGKDKETQLITDARSPVIDAGVLIWLAGDVRRIRSTAWLRFSSSQDHRNRSRRFPWDGSLEPWQQDDDSDNQTECSNPNYQTVLKLIHRYLPVDILAGRLLTPHLLGEYCLLHQ